MMIQETDHVQGHHESQVLDEVHQEEACRAVFLTLGLILGLILTIHQTFVIPISLHARRVMVSTRCRCFAACSMLIGACTLMLYRVPRFFFFAFLQDPEQEGCVNVFFLFRRYFGPISRTSISYHHTHTPPPRHTHHAPRPALYVVPELTECWLVCPARRPIHLTKSHLDHILFFRHGRQGEAYPDRRRDRLGPQRRRRRRRPQRRQAAKRQRRMSRRPSNTDAMIHPATLNMIK